MNGRLDLYWFVSCLIVVRNLLAMKSVFPFCSHNLTWPLYDKTETIQLQKVSFVQTRIQNHPEQFSCVSCTISIREVAFKFHLDYIIHIHFHHHIHHHVNFSSPNHKLIVAIIFTVRMNSSHFVCCFFFPFIRNIGLWLSIVSHRGMKTLWCVFYISALTCVCSPGKPIDLQCCTSFCWLLPTCTQHSYPSNFPAGVVQTSVC